jgi:quinoprotein glucose dehydrogenase
MHDPRRRHRRLPRLGADRLLTGAALLALVSCGEAPPPLDHAGPTAEWPHYGGDQGGMRYSPLTQITPENVHLLEPAWVVRTGDVFQGQGGATAFEATPIVVAGTMYLCTPYNRVLALDPETGEERWSYDPLLDRSVDYANQFVCRGVAHWADPELPAEATCSRRILTATNDARLIALDAATGHPCAAFGEAGEVDLQQGVGELAWPGEYQMTSPPLVLGDLVVVGSAVNDNARIDAPSGVVRAYDARSGALRWSWDPVPSDLEEPPQPVSEATGSYRHGTPNAWAPLSADPERGLVFVPTGNPSPDYWAAGRHGSDHYGSSVVALDAASGAVVWHLQTVHHDLWDFDVPAQPTVFELRRPGRDAVPALVQATKMGLLFLVDRETGEPLFPIEERAVPQTDVPGEITAPTQPFPTRPPQLVPATLTPEEAWGLTPFDRGACQKRLAALRFDGMYTPPSLEGTLMFPGNAGGSNWGGVAVDPERGWIVANTMSLPWAVTLFPWEELDARRAGFPDAEFAPQRGTPYGLMREMLVSPLDIPCNPPPWGTLAAVDAAAGEILWQVPLGTIRDLLPIPLPVRLGVPNLGGPIVTASGLVFIAATMDDYLRAFDLETGEELWKGRLPAGGQATPMTYRLRPDGRQFVVVAAGGHQRAGSRLGDSLVTFALPGG